MSSKRPSLLLAIIAVIFAAVLICMPTASKAGPGSGGLTINQVAQ